ncbi:hypothetical protein [Clostridium sp.]|uniref:hypothetical protein n=1 Tax=Clostridium sp. TaxID=1506 RepID=UPI0026223ED9|nr:hypothetical protein [Clostridium sp.]
MNRKTIKYLLSSFVLLNCLITISTPAIASSISFSNNASESSISYTHKDKDDKHGGLNIFSEENYKYLSHEQKKELLELKKCKEKGEAFTEDQQKSLHSLIECVVKGRLGDKNYADFKCLMDKIRSNEKLTDEEDKRLKEYRDIISGSKPTAADILNQFLR